MGFLLDLRRIGIEPFGLTKGQLLERLSREPPSLARVQAERALGTVGDEWVATSVNVCRLDRGESPRNVAFGSSNRAMREHSPRGANVGFIDPQGIAENFLLRRALESLKQRAARGLDIESEIPGFIERNDRAGSAGIANLDHEIHEARRLSFEWGLQRLMSEARDAVAYGRSPDSLIEKAQALRERARGFGLGHDIDDQIEDVRFQQGMRQQMRGPWG